MRAKNKLGDNTVLATFLLLSTGEARKTENGRSVMGGSTILITSWCYALTDLLGEGSHLNWSVQNLENVVPESTKETASTVKFAVKKI